MSPQAGNYLSPTISDSGMVRNDYKLIHSGFKTPLFLGASLCPALPAALFCDQSQPVNQETSVGQEWFYPESVPLQQSTVQL